jgi:hypothetical protein
MELVPPSELKELGRLVDHRAERVLVLVGILSLGEVQRTNHLRQKELSVDDQEATLQTCQYQTHEASNTR